jgi:alpha-beta hydrolase superfamily lysophospholipase
MRAPISYRATLALLTILAGGPASVLGAVEEVTFEAGDGVKLYADVHAAAAGRAAPLVLLFHQAGGDARGEYESIVPRLLEAGYNVLAVDLRSGGARFDGVNRTVAGLEGREYGYCDAFPDLVAALDQAKKLGFTGPRVVWGSSYSAALALRLAADHGEQLAAVLAFSPASGGPMAACRAAPYIPQLTVPALALRPASEMERESSREQFQLFEEHGVRTHVAPSGVHGSSMLDPGRVGADVSATWDVVLEFLAEAVSSAN